NVIHHRALTAAIPGRIAESQVDAHAREKQRLRIAGDRLPAHSKEDFLVGLRVFRREVPMTHGDTRLVEWGILRIGGTCCQCGRDKEPRDYAPHECLPNVVLASAGGTLSILACMRKLVRSAVGRVARLARLGVHSTLGDFMYAGASIMTTSAM